MLWFLSGRCVPGYRFYLRMQHWGWPSKTEAPNVRVAARAAQTVGYLERGKYNLTSPGRLAALEMPALGGNRSRAHP
jgi:hypothetical protein